MPRRTRTPTRDPRDVLAGLQQALADRPGPTIVPDPETPPKDPVRAAFEARLQLLGYPELTPFHTYPCPHAPDESCTVFVMPHEACFEHPRTYGDLGWQIYTGCEECCRGAWCVLSCGGLFRHIRVFVGGVDLAGPSTDELPPADQSIEREPD